MNRLKTRKPSALKGWLKRGTAMILALAMIVVAPVPGMSFVSHADAGSGEIAPYAGKGIGSTAYVFDQQRGDSYGVFDLEGIKDPKLIESATPYARAARSTLTASDDDYKKSTSVTLGYYGFDMTLRDEGGATTEITGVDNGLYESDKLTRDYTDANVRLQISAHPDKAHGAVVFDYTVTNLSSKENAVDWATYAKLQLGAKAHNDPTANSVLSMKSKDFYLINNATNQSFECLTTPSSGMDLTKPDTEWIGSGTDVVTTANKFGNSSATVTAPDKGMAYSYHFDLKGNETQTKSIAFRVNSPTYYVSESGSDSASGNSNDPLKTVDKAISRITTDGAKVANIYFQDNYQLNSSVVIPDGYAITFASADFNKGGASNKDVFTVTRPPDNQPMFTTGPSGGVYFKNITLDGGKEPRSEPMVKGVGSSQVTIGYQATLQNNNLVGAASPTGSAVAIFDSAKLALESCSIIDNTCEAGTGLNSSAVYFDNGDTFPTFPPGISQRPNVPSVPFTMEGSVRVDGNTRSDGTKANVYLGNVVNNNQFILVTGDMSGAKVGIASSDLPELTTNPPGANQSVTVVRPNVYYDKDNLVYKPVVNLSTFADSFSADQQGETGHPGIYPSVSGSGKDQSIVLKRGSFAMSFEVKTEPGAQQIASPPAIPDLTLEAGVNIDPPLQAPDLKAQGHKLSRIVFTPPAPTLKADLATGVITGTMPSNNVKVDYYYKDFHPSITFHTNGGTSDTIKDNEKWGGESTTVAGASTGKTKPTDLKKTGYTFQGWSKENNPDTKDFLDDAFFTVYPDDEVEVYAIFKPDPNVKFDYTEKYVDDTGKFVFKTVTEKEKYSAESPVTAGPAIGVPGYVFDSGASYTEPPTGGSPFDASGNFNRPMPAEPLTIYFVYKQVPDTDQGRFPLTVNYKSESGDVLHAPKDKVSTKAGSEVSEKPEPIAGFTCTDAKFEKGGTGDPSKGTVGAQDPPNEANSWQWNSKMPNQEVILNYTYKKIPDAWMDIHFEVEKGTLVPGGQETQNVPKGIKWDMLNNKFPVPAYTGWTGYTDDGWYTKNGDTYTKVEDKTVLTEGQTYIKRFVPDPKKPYSVTMSYQNEDGSITFGTDTLPGSGQKIEDAFNVPAPQVPGYTVDPGHSKADPDSWKFNPDGTAESVGSFEADTGAFNVTKMPGQDLKLTYTYKVDPTQTYTVTVKRESENGLDLGEGLSETHKAQDTISVPKATSVPGYVPADTLPVIQYGSSGPLLTTVSLDGTVKPDKWTIAVPNRDVTIILKYKGDPAAAKHTVTEKYVDAASGKPLSSTSILEKSVDESVSGSYHDSYGYVLQGAPDIAYTDTGVAAGGIQYIQFNGSSWSGKMPASDVVITYNLSRVTDNWVNITYKAGAYGSLSSEGQSDELKPSGTQGEYVVGVLKDDGTGNGYTFSDINTKLLLPKTNYDDHLYTFDGWYITNPDGTLEDHKVDNATQFQTDTTLTAKFVIDSQHWINISFQTENGEFTESPSTDITHVPDNWTWNDISGKLPGCKPWPSYIFDGWYKENTPVNPTEKLTRGQIYTAKFKADPAARYSCTVKYVDNATGYVFGSETRGSYLVGEEVTAAKKNVQGYTYNKGDSTTDPVTYSPSQGPGAAGGASIGTFNDVGKFTGPMPGQNLTIIYKYDRDTTKAYNLMVEYQTESGSSLAVTTGPTSIHPGDPIENINPKDVEGYNCVDAHFAVGKASVLHTGTGDVLVQPVSGEPTETSDWSWSSTMPNQDVTLVYTYKPDESSRKLTEKYVDDSNGEADIITPKDKYYKVGAPVDKAVYSDLYGYTKAGITNITYDPSYTGDLTLTGDANGVHGTMVPAPVTVTYHYTRIPSTDPNSPWGDITYKAGSNGSLNNTGRPNVASSSNAYKASILLDKDHTQTANGPYTFGDITAKKLTPNVDPATYYQFNGWYWDKNSDDVLDEGDVKVEDSQTFSAPATLIASFGEKVGDWSDITFKGLNTISDERVTLHIHKNMTWDQIDQQGKIPSYTHQLNYLEKGWYGPDNKPVDPNKPLQFGGTYTFVCYQDPTIFGTDVTSPEAAGGLNENGKGHITVYDTKTESYQYILAETDGTIVATAPGRSISDRVDFDGLKPGGRYNVYEALKTLQAAPGKNVSELGGTPGTDISAPAAEVHIPVVDDSNYKVYYDDGDGDEARTRVTVWPADPDSDYALLDSSDHVVQLPGSQDGGWMTPVPAPNSPYREVQMSGLGYGLDYTVVARPKGQAGITPESRKDDGSTITTDPAGELNLTNYIIETTSGEVVQVGDTAVGGDGCAEAHKGDTVTLSADPVNDAGEAFQHWKITIGSLSEDQMKHLNFSQKDLTFTMPGGNLVMTPVYKHNPQKGTPSYASVTDEVRGGNREEIALDPNIIPQREKDLTNPAKDRELMDVNHADVTYKVVYRKDAVKSKEKTALDNVNVSEAGKHPTAFHAAWGLNVGVERYVNGRMVKLTSATAVPPTRGRTASPSDAGYGTASPSDAKVQTASASDAIEIDARDGYDSPLTYPTYIQLGKDDADMLDYQLFEITTDPSTGEVTGVSAVNLSPVQGSAVDTNGLFTFDAQAGHRYVLVYSRAYHLRFINDLPYLPAPQQPWDFKVRRNEKPDNGDYSTEMDGRPDANTNGNGYAINPNSGAEYNYQGWSYSLKHMREFKDDRPIKDTTTLYAFYTNNEAQVAEARKNLKNTIEEAWKLSEDPFLKLQDKEDFQADIKLAVSVFQEGPPTNIHKALEQRLKDAQDALLEAMKRYQDTLNKTHEEYENIQSGGSSGGGSGGGGGGGRGTVKAPFNSTPEKYYTVGSNGSWKIISQVPGQEKELAFVLNGGLPLRSIWARLKFPDKPDSNGWYHFNSNGILDTGWFVDEAGKWYYSSTEAEGYMGKMTTGWHKDAKDGRWYYLNPVSGDMATGWKLIDGKWYYLETVGGGTYVYDEVNQKWNYTGGSGHPLGSMYQNETTPDGYRVDANGVWEQ